jgi:glycine/D-amino acid oxidase-like deaminating enzyme
MPTDAAELDAIVIGGGFYGSVIALYLVKQRGLKNILLAEQESALLTRASYNNQARVHNGYHYPRSFTTAYRSRINLPKFIHDFPESISTSSTTLYAIARRNSKVTAKQFERFCIEIGAKIQPVNNALRSLFEPRLIENIFLVEEHEFDTTKLATWAQRELNKHGVNIRLNTHVTEILKNPNRTLAVTLQSKNTGNTKKEKLNCRYVFNCTYSGLNQFAGDFPGTKTGLKQEIAEMALIQTPPELQNLGITVMDGPFFSMIPFPAKNLHTLSHVRYTPHLHWKDNYGIDPYEKLNHYDHKTRVDRMIRDAGRYVPAILNSKYVESLFEIKTVLEKNESDDGRPILFEKHLELPGCYSVLGGKIDNIYDVLEKLDHESF